ncbi:PAS domain S-box protein [Desulfococcaceae bacterium HSG7]|nr:PAS domain S-box protein [Desulfococcaceae bacterium HSG7]
MTELKSEKMGITSLYKNSVIAVTVWAAMLAALFAWNYMHSSEQILQMARKEALTVFSKDIAFRYWGTIHGGVYVPATEKTPPNKYLKHIAERDITAPSGKKLTLMNPSYMLRQIMEEYSKLYNVSGHITSLKSLNPDNAPDDWERRALKRFENGIEEAFEIVPSSDGDHLRLMRPLVTKEGCLKCHAHQGYKTGDVRGGVSMAVPLSGYYNLQNNTLRKLVITYSLIWLFGMIAFGLIFRRTKIRMIERKRSEAELQKYAHIISSTADHMSFLDRNYVYRAVNNTYLKANKKTRQEIIGHSVSDLLGVDVFERLVKEKLDSCLSGEKINYQAWFDFPDSGRRYMDVCYYPLFEDNGFVAGVSVCVHDITERKLKDDELRHHKEHLEESVTERTLELTQAIKKMNLQKKAVMNMALDLEETNNKLEKREHELQKRVKELNCLYGLSRLVEDSDNTISDILHGVIELIPPAWRYPDITSAKLVLNGEEFKTTNYAPSKQAKRRDIIVHGEKQGFLEVSYQTPEPEADEGKLLKEESFLLKAVAERLSTTIEYKQAAEALKESEEKYRLITETSMLGIRSLDIQGNIIFANDATAEMFGYTREEIIGKHFSTMLDKSSLEKGNTLFEKLLSGKSVEGEITALRKNESKFPMYFSAAPAIKNGEVVGITGVTQDITEKKKAELALKKAKEAAEAANRAKSAFLANMSHELRTPLNAILGFAQLLGHATNFNSEQHEHLGTIRRSGDHLLALINQVLDLSKIEAGRATLNVTNFDLCDLSDEMEEMFRLRAKNKELELLFERASDTPRYIRADKIKLRQILINILNNAMKFTETGGITVRVDAAETGFLQKTRFPQPQEVAYRYLRFEISDTGPGIAPDELDKLFEAFVQTRTGRESHKGTGLGLAISKRFVMLMGGDIKAESEAGLGTTFTFQIPVGMADASAIETGKPDRKIIALEPNQPRYRMLIADDVKTNRLIIINLLNPFDFELREAADGQEAVEIWKEWRPHLIWMDIRMPVMDGMEATKRIRNSELRMRNGELRMRNRKAEKADSNSIPDSEFQSRNSKIIAVTASVFKDDKVAVMASGCDDFIRKPFHESDVLNMMTKHLGVRFVYEQSIGTDSVRDKSADKNVLTSTRLNALPEEQRAALKISAIRTDPQGSNAAIDHIREHDKPLADALAGLVKTYRFDIIQELLENV